MHKWIASLLVLTLALVAVGCQAPVPPSESLSPAPDPTAPVTASAAPAPTDTPAPTDAPPPTEEPPPPDEPESALDITVDLTGATPSEDAQQAPYYKKSYLLGEGIASLHILRIAPIYDDIERALQARVTADAFALPSIRDWKLSNDADTGARLSYPTYSFTGEYGENEDMMVVQGKCILTDPYTFIIALSIDGDAEFNGEFDAQPIFASILLSDGAVAPDAEASWWGDYQNGDVGLHIVNFNGNSFDFEFTVKDVAKFDGVAPVEGAQAEYMDLSFVLAGDEMTVSQTETRADSAERAPFVGTYTRK